MSKHRPNKHRRSIRINDGESTQRFDSIRVDSGTGIQITGNEMTFQDHFTEMQPIRFGPLQPTTYEIQADVVRVNGTDLMSTIAEMNARMAAQQADIDRMRMMLQRFVEHSVPNYE